MSLTKFASTLTVCCSVALGLCLAGAAHAEVDTAKAKKTVKQKKAPAKKAPAKVVEATPEEPEPDIAGSVSTDFNCEMGNKITIYSNVEDVNHIALRWKKRLHRLQRVSTTTGANRFENPLFGLIWIGIPAKGMLLDSKKNQQLANECKDAEQMKPPVIEAAATHGGPESTTTVFHTK
jgi:hypothetical protein